MLGWQADGVLSGSDMWLSDSPNSHAGSAWDAPREPEGYQEQLRGGGQ